MKFSGYVFPFLSYTPSRTDQGVDYTGQGEILAIGRARVLKVGAPGWPEGGGVLYKLLEGPLAGQTIFVYEGVDAKVKPGQIVNAGQRIATFRPGGSLETGFANEAGVPIGHSEYVAHYDGFPTKAGKRMHAFLAQLQAHASAAGKGEPKWLKRVAGEEGGHSGIPGLNQVEEVEGNLEAHGIGGIAGEVLSGIVGDLAQSAEPLMLNIGLLGGGAFLIYYGISLMAGSSEPTVKLFQGLKRTGEVAA